MMSASSSSTIRIATRESPLALWQAHHVRDLLLQAEPSLRVELTPVTTTGDRDRTSALSSLGGVGVFTREVQRAVLDGSADLAVHSLKDLPTETVAGLMLSGVPEREARFDALVLPAGASGSLATLPQAALVGTGSLRRKSQLLAIRPDLQIQEVRGNVETRLAKLDRGEYQAIILAEAGLRRLGHAGRITELLSPPRLYPAVGQAALGLECRADDERVQDLLHRITHAATLAEVLAERACLRELRAGCHAPVGTLASVSDDRVALTAVVLSPDGTERFEALATAEINDAEQAGMEAARQLSQAGAARILQR